MFLYCSKLLLTEAMGEESRRTRCASTSCMTRCPSSSRMTSLASNPMPILPPLDYGTILLELCGVPQSSSVCSVLCTESYTAALSVNKKDRRSPHPPRRSFYESMNLDFREHPFHEVR